MKPRLHTQTPWSKVVLTALIVLGLAACDTHQAEREKVRAEFSRQQTEHSQLQRQLELAQAELARTEQALAEQQARRAELASVQTRRSAQLTRYLAEHKAASLALAATGAGAMTALDDETRKNLERELGQGAGDMAMLAGLMGAGYCLFNADECSTVAAQVASYGMERKANRDHLQQVEALMQQLSQARDGQQQAHQARQQDVQTSQGRLAQIEGRLAQLRCQGLLCGK